MVEFSLILGMYYCCTSFARTQVYPGVFVVPGMKQ